MRMLFFCGSLGQQRMSDIRKGYHNEEGITRNIALHMKYEIADALIQSDTGESEQVYQNRLDLQACTLLSSGVYAYVM